MDHINLVFQLGPGFVAYQLRDMGHEQKLKYLRESLKSGKYSAYTAAMAIVVALKRTKAKEEAEILRNEYEQFSRMNLK